MPESRFQQLLKTIKVWNHISAVWVTVGGFFLAQAATAIVVVLYALLSGWDQQRISNTLSTSVLAIFLFTLFVYGVYVWIIRSYLRWSGHSFKDIGLVRPKSFKQIIKTTLLGFGVYFASVILTSMLVKLIIPAVDLDQRQELGFSTTTSGAGLMFVFLSLVIIPPIAEEIATRGFLYTGLRKKLPIIWAGLITSIIFAMAHLQWESDAPLLWAAAIDTFVLSAVLVYVREKSGSLLPAIGIHMIKNCIAFLALFVFRVA